MLESLSELMIGERITVGENVSIHIIDIVDGKVEIGIDAPEGVPILIDGENLAIP